MQPQPEDFNPYAPPTADVDQRLQLNLDGYELADRGVRFAAAVIDGLLVTAAALPGIIVMFALIGSITNTANWMRYMNEGTFFLGIGVSVLLVLAFSIYQWYLIATTGQSLAKRWLGIMIVRTDGTACGFVNGVILRSWVIYLIANFIPFIGWILWLVDALMIFGDERRCLHDHIASTRVVVAPKA